MSIFIQKIFITNKVTTPLGAIVCTITLQTLNLIPTIKLACLELYFDVMSFIMFNSSILKFEISSISISCIFNLRYNNIKYQRLPRNDICYACTYYRFKKILTCNSNNRIFMLCEHMFAYVFLSLIQIRGYLTTSIRTYNGINDT